MSTPETSRRTIHRYRAGRLTVTTDDIAPESPLLIQLHGTRASAPRAVAVTMRTPGPEDELLALGFLFSEGILESRDQLAAVLRPEDDTRNTVTIELKPGVNVDWGRLERHGYTSSSCGVCGKTSLEQVHQTLPFPEALSPLSVSPDIINQAPDTLRAAQQTFATTGGIHAAGLFTPGGKLIHHAEDVGRHNALDKLVGHALLAGLLPLGEHLLVLSGRASFELIQKAAMAGIRIVIAVGAPSTLAIDLAAEQSITLCGFVRGGGFNCYCGAERITTPDQGT